MHACKEKTWKRSLSFCLCKSDGTFLTIVRSLKGIKHNIVEVLSFSTRVLAESAIRPFIWPGSASFLLVSGTIYKALKRTILHFCACASMCLFECRDPLVQLRFKCLNLKYLNRLNRDLKVFGVLNSLLLHSLLGGAGKAWILFMSTLRCLWSPHGM